MNSHFGAEEVDASESSKDTLNAMAILEESAATVQRVRGPSSAQAQPVWRCPPLALKTTWLLA